jgi:peptidoglycan/xylan/chitin deacetylase (PgdA/CDA1 family)
VIGDKRGGLIVSLARSTVALGVRWIGVAPIVRAIVKRKVAILVYHNPPAVLFERHLAYLAKHYTFLTLDNLVDALHKNDWASIPDGAVVITLDDGLRGNASLLPALSRHGVKPTIYVCTQIVCTDRRFWFLSVPDPEPLKRIDHAERLEQLDRAYNFSPTRSFKEPQALTIEQFRALGEHVDYGSHTRFHPILPTCDDGESEIEIIESKLELEDMTGETCHHFSYPNGDYTDREVELVKQAGYASARTMDFGWNDETTDPFRLKAIHIRDDASVTRLVADLTGVAGYAKVLRLRLTKSLRRRSSKRSTPSQGEAFVGAASRE